MGGWTTKAAGQQEVSISAWLWQNAVAVREADTRQVIHNRSTPTLLVRCER